VPAGHQRPGSRSYGTARPGTDEPAGARPARVQPRLEAVRRGRLERTHLLPDILFVRCPKRGKENPSTPCFDESLAEGVWPLVSDGGVPPRTLCNV